MDIFAHEMAVAEERLAESDGLTALANLFASAFDDRDSLLEDSGKTGTEDARKMIASGHCQLSGSNRIKHKQFT